jgi:hypothetical protein
MNQAAATGRLKYGSVKWIDGGSSKPAEIKMKNGLQVVGEVKGNLGNAADR